MLSQCHVHPLRHFGTHFPARLLYRFPSKLDASQSASCREALDAFIKSLSERSIHARFHGRALCEPAQRQQWIAQFIEGINEGRIMACLAQEGRDVVGIAEAYRLAEDNAAEVSLLVGDALQGKGVGSRMLRHLEEKGRQAGIDILMASIDDMNVPAQRMMTANGYRYRHADAVWAKTL